LSHPEELVKRLEAYRVAWEGASTSWSSFSLARRAWCATLRAMRRALLLISSAFFLACGGTQSPTSSPAGAPAAEAGSAAASAAEPCLASTSRDRPAVPMEEVGSVVVHLGKDACSVEARGVDGAAKPVVTACDSPRKAQEAARLAACSLGGDKLWPKNKGDAMKGSVIELSVGRFTKTDAKADLELICAPFASLKNPATGESFELSSLDPSQRAAIRAALLEETMTSRQWRLWLHGFQENREASIATLRAAAKAASLTCESEWTTTP
jgi:hypothetical protein